MKKKRATSVLRKQKTKHKRPWGRWVLGLTLLGLTLGLSWQAYRFFEVIRPKITSTLTPSPKYLDQNFQIDFVYSEKMPESFHQEQLKAKLSKEAMRSSHDSHDLIRRLNSLVWRFDTRIEQSSIVMAQSDRLIVKIAFREALFKFSTKKPLLLSTKGQVFRGQEDAAPTGQNSLATLTLRDGLESQLTRSFDNGNHLVLNAQLKKGLTAALDLMENLKHSDLKSSAYYLEAFRGIEIELTESGTSVMLGWPPYQKKIDRLRSILTSYSETPTKAARIELDFSDKAFIEEKTVKF